jgi:hypothetical protein
MRQVPNAFRSTAALIRANFTVLLLIMFSGSAIARGDTIGDTVTFLDATDHGGPVTVVATDPARISITPGLIDGLVVTLQAPSPTASFVKDDCPLGQIGCEHINVGEFPINPDPSLDFESDVLSGFSPSSSTYQVQILIEPDGLSGLPCIAETACLVREDGLLHTVDTITWSDGTVDTIKFQSVPEPASLLLVGTGLLLLAGIIKRKVVS